MEIFAKDEKELEIFIQTIRIYSQEFGIEKNVPCLKRETKETDLLNQNTWGKKTNVEKY